MAYQIASPVVVVECDDLGQATLATTHSPLLAAENGTRMQEEKRKKKTLAKKGKRQILARAFLRGLRPQRPLFITLIMTSTAAH